MINRNWKGMNCGAGGGAVYGLGFIGAVIYYLQNAATLGEVILGILKAIVWPGMLVYKLFGLWRM